MRLPTDYIPAAGHEKAGWMTDLVNQTRDRRRAVSTLCADFHRSRAEMARQAEADRQAFVCALRQAVAAQQRDLWLDLIGARRAWAGLDPLLCLEPRPETSRAAEPPGPAPPLPKGSSKRKKKH